MSTRQLSFAFEVLANISSFVCFLLPLPKFYKVCKQKSMEGLQMDSTSYVAALFNSMLWICYAFVRTGETPVITINAFGCFIQMIYLAIFLTFCNKESRISTLKMIAFWNIRAIASIVILIHVLAKREETRVKLIEAIDVCVFAAPLSIIRVVLHTGVKYLPLRLFILLLASANVIWLLYGIFLKDIYVTVPSVLELIIFGFTQYAMHGNNNHPENNNNNNITNENIEANVVVETGEIQDDDQQQHEQVVIVVAQGEQLGEV